MAADCEIDQCGVLAIGRCIGCRKAFCQSHRERPVREYGDVCSACQTANIDRQRSISERILAAQEKIRSIAEALAAAKIEPDELYFEAYTTKRRTFGRDKTVEDPSRDEYGWPLGTYTWMSHINTREGLGTINVEQGTYLTIDGYIVPDGTPSARMSERDHTDLYSRLRPGFPEVDGWEAIAEKVAELAREKGVDV